MLRAGTHPGALFAFTPPSTNLHLLEHPTSSTSRTSLLSNLKLLEPVAESEEKLTEEQIKNPRLEDRCAGHPMMPSSIHMPEKTGTTGPSAYLRLAVEYCNACTLNGDSD
jgi:hypothetical protein